MALAPLSVKPCYQRQGVGTALILEGHKIAKELGYQYSVVLGSETYYPRVGYVPAQQLGIHAPDGIPAENFMAIPLQENAPPLRGTMAYAQECGMETNAEAENQYVIFDMDGLMFDTEGIFVKACDYAGEKIGIGKAGSGNLSESM